MDTTTPMKRFAGHRSYEAIKAACEAQALKLNDRLYTENGWDSIVISGGGAEVLYDTTTGRFHGTTPDGVEFTSQQNTHEAEPWFQGLLAFFYVGAVDDAAAPAGAPA